MDLTSAVGKHAEWKTKFRTAIKKKEQMDVATIAKDNCCELGKWLHGEAKSQFGRMASYTECVAKHAVFHTEAAKVATAINSGKYTVAEAMLDGGTPYTNISSEVGVAIMHLKKEAGL
jgi:methyl-accepting chemotaxis protein